MLLPYQTVWCRRYLIQIWQYVPLLPRVQARNYSFPRLVVPAQVQGQLSDLPSPIGDMRCVLVSTTRPLLDFLTRRPILLASYFLQRPSPVVIPPLKLCNCLVASFFTRPHQLKDPIWNHHLAFSAMNSQELANYLADSPPSVVRLEIEKHFESLTDKQKRYAHFISK